MSLGLGLALPGYIGMGGSVGTTGTAAPFVPTQLGSCQAWYQFNTGITEAGSGVSQWDDQSGNARNLAQATDTNRPAKQVDGSILFDGVDNFLITSTFSFAQPYTIYLRMRQVTWTLNDRIFDGASIGQHSLFQSATTPALTMSAGVNLASNSNLAVNTYGAVCCVFNGSSSVLQIDNTTPLTGNAHVNGFNGLTLGARGTGDAQWGNIQVKEVIVYSKAHDQATREQVIAYLNSL